MIDQERLSELEDDFGAEDLQEIIEAFLAEADETVRALGQTLSDGPTVERDGHLHFLKGCARNIGAMALGDYCETLEGASTGYSRDQHSRMTAEFQNVCDYFAGEQQRLSA